MKIFDEIECESSQLVHKAIQERIEISNDETFLRYLTQPVSVDTYLIFDILFLECNLNT